MDVGLGTQAGRAGLRILVLTNMYPPHAYGGYEQLCRDAVEGLRARGHEVLVLTSTVRVPEVGLPESPEPPEAPRRVRRELALYWDDHEIVRPPCTTRLRMERANRRAFDRAHRDFEPDVVSAWAMGAMSMGLLRRPAQRGTPTVSVLCDEWPVYGPQVDSWLRPFLDRPVLARLARVATGLPTAAPPLDRVGPALFISEALRGAARAGSPWGFPDSSVVYAGIDLDTFRPDPVERESGERESGERGAAGSERPWRWRLLYVGRVDPRKGIDVAVRALARCPSRATLTVVGRGDDRYRDELVALAVRLGVARRVSFTHAGHDRLPRIYRRADVAVFPPTWEEPFGLVPVEAMACGTPVVASATGGSAEFLVDAGEPAGSGNCLHFPPGDDAALAEALHRLAGDVALRTRLVRGGLATAAELGVERWIDALEAWHVAAVAGQSAPRPPHRPPPGRPAATATPGATVGAGVPGA